MSGERRPAAKEWGRHAALRAPSSKRICCVYIPRKMRDLHEKCWPMSYLSLEQQETAELTDDDKAEDVVSEKERSTAKGGVRHVAPRAPSRMPERTTKPTYIREVGGE